MSQKSCSIREGIPRLKHNRREIVFLQNKSNWKCRKKANITLYGKVSVYPTWTDCKAQVSGYAGAKYKAFDSQEEAEAALEAGYTGYLQKVSSPKTIAKWKPEAAIGDPIQESLAGMLPA